MALVPELSVRDWIASLDFYRNVIGFAVEYGRPDEGFAMLVLDDARLMIDQIGKGRTFDEALIARHPLGVGMNLEIRVPDVDAIAARVAPDRVVIPLEDKVYGVGEQAVAQRQMVVRDPDGYLLRPWQPLGAE
ncbi:MAG: VOC family protein [Paracoccus denitrificans]|nr:MAG: VOC family protein [Paracoccus denitrificans]PZO83414.1 MAG: VOC family protein [Paracoccus denitrificans]